MVETLDVHLHHDDQKEAVAVWDERLTSATGVGLQQDAPHASAAAPQKPAEAFNVLDTNSRNALETVVEPRGSNP